MRSKPIDRVVVWNRTDGGQGIIDRLKGFKLLLLDDDHQVLWQQTPDSVPSPDSTLSPSGEIELKFAAALADFEQQGFPAAAVLSDKVDKKKGWAVAPKTGEPHQLTLMLQKPLQLADGILTVRLHHDYEQKQHVLERFRFSMTSDPDVAQWARMPAAIQKICPNRR